jgi:metal-sulfur cluster biosynthetic enzyme
MVHIDMTLTAPGCGMGDILVDDVRSKVEMVPTIKRIDIELVLEPRGRWK